MFADCATWQAVGAVQDEGHANPAFLMVALETCERCVGTGSVDVTGAAIVTGEDDERVP